MTQPRHIIVLSDGTGNSRGKAHRTNVWRTYEALDLEDPREPECPRQFAFYDDGVGTSSFKPLALLGGAVGYGLARNVRDLYEFISRTYREGDRIYAFGFSRGAFTIRVLLGLIASQGLLPYHGDETELRRLSKAAFRAYRCERYKLPLNWIALPRMLRDGVIDAWARLRGHRRYTDVVKQRMVDIEFVGVWDTVAAYGMPIDELAIFINKVLWPLDMPGLALSPRVRNAVHALALDDERATFHPKLWDPDPGRIQQVWFAGMHSDVGGGYPDQGLAHVSLQWMLSEAQKHQLRLRSSILQQQQALADENGPMNDSRHGLAGYYRYRPREPQPGSLVHESVLRRIQVGQDAYAPIVLPETFRLLGFDGVVRSNRDALQAPNLRLYEAGRQRALNGVWLRRGVYFATVGVTIVLLLLPWTSTDRPGGCSSSWCWMSSTIQGLRVLLPSMLEGWVLWYANHPGTSVLWISLVIAGLVLGSVLQRSIFDVMRSVWYVMPAVRPTTLAADDPVPLRLSRVSDAMERLRTSSAYQAVIRNLRRIVLPAISGTVLVALTLVLLNAWWFAILSSHGSVCLASPDPGSIGMAMMTLSQPFENSEVCASTGLRVEAGGTYEIVLTIREDEPWMDDTLPADWRGVTHAPLRHRLAWPLKRELSQPIFWPMARIGAKGSDVYALSPDPSMPMTQPRRSLTTRIVARTEGELFIYLNDAIGPLWDRTRFYRNNQGRATIQVRQVAPSKQ